MSNSIRRSISVKGYRMMSRDRSLVSKVDNRVPPLNVKRVANPLKSSRSKTGNVHPVDLIVFATDRALFLSL